MTRRCLRRVIAVFLAALAILTPVFPQAQFYTLSTAEGLSDNYINSMTVDRNGYLWVGTGSGLNRFNGKQVERFFDSGRTPLRSDIIRQVSCDSANRIWVVNDKLEVTLIDADRRFIPLSLRDAQGPLPVRNVLQADPRGPVLLTPRGLYRFDDRDGTLSADSFGLEKFTRLDIPLPDSILSPPFHLQPDMGGHRIALSSPKTLFILDLLEGRTIGPVACPGCRVIGSLDGLHPAIYMPETRTVYTLEPAQGTRTPIFDGILDQAGRPPEGLFIRMIRLDGDDFLLNTWIVCLPARPATAHPLSLCGRGSFGPGQSQSERGRGRSGRLGIRRLHAARRELFQS
jgi:hypothetical protein